MCPQTTPGRDKDFLTKMSLYDFERIVDESTSLGAQIINLEGSGEPTLNSDLPRYISIVKKYNAKAYIFSNGARMRGSFMRACVDSGLDYFRFSIIGYTKELYKHWMGVDNFDLVLANLHEMLSYAKETTVASYHLVIEDEDKDVQSYRNIIPPNVKMEIWKMHNWSGVYTKALSRTGDIKTCGRPFFNDIVVRAGGINGKKLAVHPCCQVLGNDKVAVLGHLSENTIKEVLAGPLYNELRYKHTIRDFPDYCKSCDFLIEDKSVLVYTNAGRQLNNLTGLSENMQRS